MEVILTNLSNELYDESRLRLNNSGLKYGLTLNSYSYKDIINTDFYKTYSSILKLPKGSGCWLWKPYIILESFAKLKEGDLVVYCDSGIEIISDLSPLYEICLGNEPVLLFGNANDRNESWTKRDCFILMGCDSPSYWSSPHCDASFSLWRKCDHAIKFLKDWLKYGSDERIITDLPNACGKDNLPAFIDHRWDQSILSLLAQKNKLNLYRIPTQFGNHYKTQALRIKDEFNCINQSEQSPVKYYSIIPYYNSPYLQLLDHHRTKKGSIEQIVTVEMKANVPIMGKLAKITNKFLRMFNLQLKRIDEFDI